MQVELPKAVNIPTQTKPENITVAVDKDGNIYWNGVLMTVSRTSCSSHVKEAAVQKPQPECTSAATRMRATRRWAASSTRSSAAAREGRVYHRTRSRHARLQRAKYRSNCHGNECRYGGGDVMCDINTTPLIDVMLVLLVTLIISLPIMTHAVKLDMPQANNPPPPELRPEVIDLEIDFDGTVVWNGTVVPICPRSRATSAPRLEGSAAGDPPASGPARQVRHRGDGAGRGAAQSHEQDRVRQHNRFSGLIMVRLKDPMQGGSRWVASVAAALMLIGVGGAIPPAFSQAKPTVSKAVAKPLKAAQEAMQAKRYQEALAKLHEVQAISGKNDYDQYLVDEMLGFIAVRTKDFSEAAQRAGSGTQLVLLREIRNSAASDGAGAGQLRTEELRQGDRFWHARSQGRICRRQHVYARFSGVLPQRR